MSHTAPIHTYAPVPNHISAKFRYEITGNKTSSTPVKRFSSLPEQPYSLYFLHWNTLTKPVRTLAEWKEPQRTLSHMYPSIWYGRRTPPVISSGWLSGITSPLWVRCSRLSAPPCWTVRHQRWTVRHRAWTNTGHEQTLGMNRHRAWTVIHRTGIVTLNGHTGHEQTPGMNSQTSGMNRHWAWTDTRHEQLPWMVRHWAWTARHQAWTVRRQAWTARHQAWTVRCRATSATD